MSDLPPCEPPIETPPKNPGKKNYTNYRPQPHARVRADVLRVAGNGSFVSRCLLVITREGETKNFETITGQDGLTFGIADFASDAGVAEFMDLLSDHQPEVFQQAFGGNAPRLLDRAWIKRENNSARRVAAYDAGLIRFDWMRFGLDRIVTNRRLRGLQLENFRRGKIDGSHRLFTELGFVLEFTLGTMIGIANSQGVSGMRARLAHARQSASGTGAALEQQTAERLLRSYVSDDPNPGTKDEELLDLGFAGQGTAHLPHEGLSHRGRRAYQLFKHFPWSAASAFGGLGEFALESDERFIV
jgi:hypothetical protein